MKLIIDIPEEDYEWINTHRSVTDYQTTKMLYKRVLNGTPFDSVIKDIKKDIHNTLCFYYGSDIGDGLEMAERIIDKHISGKENE